MIVDLSVPLASAPLVAGIFGCEVSELPDGKGWASETVTAITHAGTHVDAPYHYLPTCEGEGTEWLLDRGVKVIGTGACGLDRPLGDLRAQFEREGDPAPRR